MGFFDGVHIAHRAIISEAVRLAESAFAPSAVWMISADSRDYKMKPPLLTPEAEKLALIRECGAEFAVLSDFDSVRHLSGEEFVGDFLASRLGVSAVVCGFNFRFGTGAAWDICDLAKLCEDSGIRCVTLPEVHSCGVAVSSSEIRSLISVGKVDEAARLLGRPYSITLPVLEGKKLGRTLGFPTANQIIPEDRVSPAVGVYAVRVTLPDGRVFPGAANVGHCPTFDFAQCGDRAAEGAATAESAVCETYILDYSGDLYGQNIKLEFLRRLRGEVKFGSPSELISQVKRDAVSAKDAIGDYAPHA